MGKEIDWPQVCNAYIYGNDSYRGLAKAMDISGKAVELRGKAEGWPAMRREKRSEVARQAAQQAEQQLVAQETQRLERVNDLADALLARLEQAAGELDSHLVTHKRKVKTVAYGEDKKLVREETAQEEQLAVELGVIDRQGLKVLTAALKDLHSLTATRTAPDNGCLPELIAGLQVQGGEESHGDDL